jgi:acetyl esterase/lipase
LNKLKILKVLLGFFSVLLLLWGVLWGFLLFFGGRLLRGITILLEEFVAQSSTLMIGICASATIILLKLLASRRFKHPKQYYAIAIIGFTITGINSVSLLATPFTINYANAEFTNVFGSNWENQIPNDINEKFLQIPYNFPSHFLTIPEKPIQVEKDILFYEGENISLYFDVYSPVSTPSQLPGKGSIVVNLHPGAWMSGGKGTWNMISTSKYLAGQGYVVFDIEYGLINWFQYAAAAPDTPEHVMGNFTIEDQIRHIGIFTKLLEEELATTYRADLNSVYFMGRSAGAHLAGVCGLGYNYYFHNGTLSPNLTVKGIIPLYPPSAAPDLLLKEDRETNPELYAAYDLTKLADPQDPPILIFQGTSDGQVSIEGVEILKLELETQGVHCCLLKFPFAGHANDFVLNSNIGQVWAYYLERFLFLTQ